MELDFSYTAAVELRRASNGALLSRLLIKRYIPSPMPNGTTWNLTPSSQLFPRSHIVLQRPSSHSKEYTTLRWKELEIHFGRDGTLLQHFEVFTQISGCTGNSETVRSYIRRIRILTWALRSYHAPWLQMAKICYLTQFRLFHSTYQTILYSRMRWNMK